MGLALAIGLAGGLINGILIARFNITPILCTLGTQMAFMGLAVVVSGGRAVMVGSPDRSPATEVKNPAPARARTGRRSAADG